MNDKVSKAPRRNNITTYFKLIETIHHIMTPIKNTHDCKGAYVMECSCGKGGIGETHYSLLFKEHGAHIKNECTCSLALANISL